MARIVKLEATGPVKIEPSEIPEGKALFICACGLTKKFPFCDGSQSRTDGYTGGALKLIDCILIDSDQFHLGHPFDDRSEIHSGQGFSVVP